MKRIILIIADSFGIGAAKNANKYGDEDADTFLHTAEHTPDFDLPNMRKMGLGNIKGSGGGNFTIPPNELIGSFARMREQSVGKDTITGHWEICGIETLSPFKTYPDGFPDAFIKKFEEAIGRKVIGNYPASGTEIINILGDEHEATGKPIVYTSADSVFQIAANTAVIPLEELYEICKKARKLLVGDWACGRVIARPYVIDDKGDRVRTTDRRDFSVSPPEDTVLDNIVASGQEVCAVGKIHDIFNGKGITESVHIDGNMDGIDKTIEGMKKDFLGLIFTNLVDFDTKYGHRRNPLGYGQALMEFDKRLPEVLDAMRRDDVLMISADHGNDPVHSGYDHTKEDVPLLICGNNIKSGVDLGVRDTFADCGATIADYLEVEKPSIGTSFLSEIFQG